MRALPRRKLDDSVVYIESDSAPRILFSGEDLLLEDFPDDLHRRLNERAARNHRSMAREALAILQAVLRGLAGPPRLEEIDAWRIKGAKPLTDELLEEARRAGRP